MRSSSCQIEFANEADTVRCGRPAVVECAECGISLCSGCRTECCAIHSVITAMTIMWRIPSCTCDIALVQGEEIRTPRRFALLTHFPF
jgi:hypothetical protein